MLLRVGRPVVSSSLTFAGLTEADARSIESVLVQGIAGSIAGVSAADVTITGYSAKAQRRLTGLMEISWRRLTGSLVVQFEVRSARNDRMLFMTEVLSQGSVRKV